MVNKKRFFFVTFLLVAVLFATLASSALSGVTLVSPGASTNISGTYTFNATITGTATNVTFYWWNSTGSLWKLLCYNSTAGAGPFTCTYDTTNLPDGTTNTFNASAINGTASARQTSNNSGVTVDNTVPEISIDIPSSGWYDQNISIYANASDATTNVTNSTMYFWFGNSTGNFSKTLLTSCGYAGASTGFNCSRQFNTTALADGNYTLWVNASDTLGNVGYQSRTKIGVDNSPPTATFSCSPHKDLYTDTNVTCSCSPSDAGSGVNSLLTSYKVYPSTSNIGTFSLTCDFGDNLGNTNSTTTSYNVLYASSSGSPGSTGAGSTASGNVEASSQNLFSQISVGTPAIAKGFDSGIGVQQITINVKNAANNVQIVVSSYDGKPSEVSVNKSGKVFQYFHINAQNLETSLDNAVIEVRVNKSWVSANSLNYTDVSLFKFDNSLKVWNDLNASYSSQDSNYYYYNATVTSFSYFAISQKSVTENAVAQGNQTSEQTNSATQNSAAMNSAWFWIIVSVIIVVIVGTGVWLFFRIKNRQV